MTTIRIDNFWRHICVRCYSPLRGDEVDGCEVCALMDEEEVRQKRHLNFPDYQKAMREAWSNSLGNKEVGL